MKLPTLSMLSRGNHLGILCLVVAVGLSVSGCVTIVRGLSEQKTVSHSQSLGTIPAAAKIADRQSGLFMDYALPSSIAIPAIATESVLTTVGKTASGAIDTPKAPAFDTAAWYHDSPAPGQYGASVIVGHVDSYANDNGASVFYNLHKLKPGDIVNVKRSDNSTAVFKVYALREYGREKVPAEQVYSPHTNNAELRLITCSGTFDTAAGEYTDNTVVYASLSEVRAGS